MSLWKELEVNKSRTVIGHCLVTTHRMLVDQRKREKDAAYL